MSYLARTLAVALMVGLMSALPASAQLLGPTAYVQASNSPFAAFSFTNYNHLETFEDLLLNTPGVSASAGSPIGPGGNTDSVDADDGVVDGSGTNGRSFFAGDGSTGITFTFNAATLGALPTHAGIVWTDGLGTITFEAFDALGVSAGVVTASHADGSFFGGTAEDRFYGYINTGGISRINIRNSIGGIEVDHLQYARGVAAVVPEAGTLALLGFALVPVGIGLVRSHTGAVRRK